MKKLYLLLFAILCLGLLSAWICHGQTNGLSGLAPVVTAVQSTGIKLNDEQIAAIVSTGGVIIRWLQLEIASIIAQGGIVALWTKFWGTKPTVPKSQGI
jgi:hypothetical protein